jgi:hypothetical protein
MSYGGFPVMTAQSGKGGGRAKLRAGEDAKLLLKCTEKEDTDK